MTTQFQNPGTATALDWKDLNGRLLMINPHRVEVDVKTVHGLKDVTIADVHVIDGDDPRELCEAFIFPSGLQGQLRALVGTGQLCLARLGQGIAKPGQSPPWKLFNCTDADRVLATQYIERLNGSRIAAPGDTASAGDTAPAEESAPGDDVPPWEK